MLAPNLQNEDLTSIGVKLAEWIVNDDAIKNFCQENFDRDIKVLVGPPEALMPSAEDAPYAFIEGLAKSEGAHNNKPVYQCVLCVGVDVTGIEDAETESGVIVLAGQQYCSELMTLIQDALYRYGGDDGCNPPSITEQMMPGIVRDNKNHYEGFLTAVWQFELGMGMKIRF